jgi:hypothetical protein
METSAGRVISTILKHDSKITSYKIALIRAINDVAMSYPDISSHRKDIAIPLKTLARFWLAYYFPFFDNEKYILQGNRSDRQGVLRNDMAFREDLFDFRNEWTKMIGFEPNPADGFFIINEFNLPRKRKNYQEKLLFQYFRLIEKISATIQMPIRYAGEGQWSVFDKPIRFKDTSDDVIAIPGTDLNDKCVIVSNDLWLGFQEMSLYIEALCIHEWSLFTEQKNEDDKYDRGFVYRLLTVRPDNRRPLTWERNQVDILLMEDKEFFCPWTKKVIKKNTKYDLDHLIPISIYPINELWNLIPSDPYYNSHVKRNRMPSIEKLQNLKQDFQIAYEHYLSLASTENAIYEDVKYRFIGIQENRIDFPDQLSKQVILYVDQLAIARNVARF